MTHLWCGVGDIISDDILTSVLQRDRQIDIAIAVTRLNKPSTIPSS